MLFQYKAIKNGQVITKQIEAESEQVVITFLRENNFLPIKITKAAKWGTILTNATTSLTDRISAVDIIDFTRQLAIMLNAGLTIVDSLAILKKQTKKKKLLQIIEAIDENIRAGYSFSVSLKIYSKYFSNLYISLVKAGEASGKLSEILLKLAETMEKDRELKGKLKNALIYPAIVFTSMLIVMFVVVTFVIPKLLGLYKDFNIEFPLTTRILISISNFCASYWPFIIAAVVVFVIFARRYAKTKHGRFMRDSLLMKAPIVSNTFKMSSLVDNVRTLALMTGAGVPILESLSIIIETTNNVVFQKAFSNALKNVEKGMSLGDAFSTEEVFPPILIQMTKVGESTGQLDYTLTKLSAYFEVETELAIKNMTTLIEPTILIILGLGVGVLVVSVITPIYNITNSFK